MSSTARPARRSNDGFNVVWISTSAADELTAAQVAAGYGRVMLQRMAVALDARVDPLGPPQAAGLDGVPGGASDAPVNVGNEAGAGATIFGRDPATIVTHDGETVVSWIDLADQVHLRIYGTAGNLLDGGIAGANLASLGTASATGVVKLVDLAGSGFVATWVQPNAIGLTSIAARIFTPGAAAGTYTASPTILLQDNLPPGFDDDYSLGTLVDSGGFSLAWSQATATGEDVLVKHFTAGGLSDGFIVRANTTLAGDQTAPSLGGLVGDRVVAVWQDDPTVAAGDQDIRMSILDTRTDAFGNPIVLNGPGVTLAGDVGGNGAPRAIADVLVGSIGRDALDGVAGDDELHGALGDDTLTGGSGDDLVYGDGGNGDIAVFSGNRADYGIVHLGGDIFAVSDLRGGTPDGTDQLFGVEILRFADDDVTAFSIIAGETPVTPTPWGWTDADGDKAPDLDGTPDVDGFVVNHAPEQKAGVQQHLSIADSVGEFVAIAWESGAPGATHIRGQFYDVVLAPDIFKPLTLSLSDGIGIETAPVIVSGGANSGWGVAFEQRDDAADVTHTIRTNFVGPSQLTSTELTVLDEGANVDQHDIALSGSYLDRTLASPVGGSVLPVGMNEGYNVVWVSTDLPADGSPVADARYGRIMLQRFEVPLDALGNPGAPMAGGVDGIHDLGSDAAVWVGDEAGTGAGGIIGRDPSTFALHTFETGIVWIEGDGAGGERVAGRFYDDLGQVIPMPEATDISGGFAVAAGTEAKMTSAGAVNFGIVWVTPNDGVLTVMGRYISSPGTGLDGQDFSLLTPAPFTLFNLPRDVSAADLELNVTGISGEDSNDIVVTWKQSDGHGGTDIMAQHVRVALDPISGMALAMVPDGDIIRVNADDGGSQDQSGVAGLLGDRFIAAWHDDNASYTDGNDIIARVVDTRDTADPAPITGDLIRAGRVMPRRDILVGTNGDDSIRGDISDADGLVDSIFGGLGDDTIQGGPGTRGAAGIPEIIDGGEGEDVAVFTGRRQDYSITINGDGSIEVIDLRPTSDAAGDPLLHDGIDNLYRVEKLRFLNLTQADPNPAEAPAPTTISVKVPGAPPPLNSINGESLGPYDGTPVLWSLDDSSAAKLVQVSASAGDELTQHRGVAVTNLQTEAAMAWTAGDGVLTDEVWGVRYDVLGKPDPLFALSPVQLTDGTSAGATVSAIDIAMTGGLGFTAVWESETAGDTTIHLRFGSTNTQIVLDPAAGVPGAGLAGGEITVTESAGEGGEVADQPVVQGYEIVDDQNDTLEFGFHIGFVLKEAAGDAYGKLLLARYEIPVYDLALAAAGLPVLDAAGQGILATDPFGNLVPSADLSKGAETAPISIGLDGLRGTGDDGLGIMLADDGLHLADDVEATPLRGRDISVASLHDGQLVVTYVGEDEHVHLRIYVPQVDQEADREVGGVGADVIVRGVTSYQALALPFGTDLGTVAPGQVQYAVAQQNGSFGVFWAAQEGSHVAVKGIIYAGAGTNWSPSPVLTLADGLEADVRFQVAPTGVTPGGLEDGFLLTFEDTSGGPGTLRAQRFDMLGNAVGATVVVDGGGTSHQAFAVAGTDDGRVLIGFETPDGAGGTEIDAQILDTRQSGELIIGPRTGAPRDVLVGTIGDDAMDGRALDDELHGGLGGDLLSLGAGDDTGFGGSGSDTIIGGSGQDQLLGEGGDDLLWAGANGPAGSKLDADVQTALTALGIAPALVASIAGLDLVSGGAGSDTLSLEGEFGDFAVDLAAGIVTSDRSGAGLQVVEDLIGAMVDDGAGGTIFQFTNDVENATGGLGNDTLLGTNGDNRLEGGEGSDVIDGRGGFDTVVLRGALGDYLIGYDSEMQVVTLVAASGEVTTVRGVESFIFADGTRSLEELLPGPAAVDDTAVLAEDGAVSIDVLANDANADASHVTAVNGIAVVKGGPAVGVAHGTVALTSSGPGSEHLVFTADANYYGPVSFTYTVSDDFGHFSNAAVAVAVTNTEDAPTDLVFNGNPAMVGTTLAENAADGTVVASLATIDPDNAFGEVNDSFAYSLLDSFGGRFAILGSSIVVANGSLLDFEAAPNSFVLTVTTSDLAGASLSEAFLVGLSNVDEAPVNLALSAASFSEAAPNGTVIGLLSAQDPEGAGVRFDLVDDAGGRFKVVKDAAGYKLAVAENLLIDHVANDLAHSYSVQVRATDATGHATVQTLTVTATGVAENRVAGGNANANTLNGTAATDNIDGGAGKDTMAGLGGNDVYFVDNSGDKVTEASGGGTDTIYTTLASFDLSSAANVENLVFTGAGAFSGKLGSLAGTLVGGAGNDQLSGSGLADLLEGRAGNDTMSGGAGADTIVGGGGNDVMTGGAGNDVFVFRSGSGSDAVTDFGAVAGTAHDVIQLDASAFAGFAAMLGAGAFTQVGQDVVIALGGGDSLTLQKVTLASIDATDFVFA